MVDYWLHKVIFLNMESLLAALFWGNFVSFLFLCLYYRSIWKKGLKNEKLLATFLLSARLLQAIYYCLALGRGTLPDWISVRIACTLLFFGFYFETQAIFQIIKENTLVMKRLVLILLAASIVALNVVESVMPSSGLRILATSAGVVAIMALPCTRMLLARDSSPFAKSVAVMYCIFLFLLLPRAWNALQNQEVNILTTNAFQSITFLSLLLLLIVSLPAYILIIMEYANSALTLMATTDKVTGATNRHAFLEAASAVCGNCRKLHLSVSLLFIDVDHFKKVNDQYGHNFGDSVLVRLASIIDGCLRGSDLSCRYGGEEFVVLLPCSGCVSAKFVAERIANAVRTARFDEHPDFSFTVSIGVANGVPSRHYGLMDIIKDADKAMYDAKRAGRDCIAVANEAC